MTLTSSSRSGDHNLRDGVWDHAEGEVQGDQAQDCPVPRHGRWIRHYDDGGHDSWVENIAQVEFKLLTHIQSESIAQSSVWTQVFATELLTRSVEW